LFVDKKGRIILERKVPTCPETTALQNSSTLDCELLMVIA